MNETTDATAIFAPIWARKWLILAVAIVVGVASYLYFKHQRPTYQATTQVYLGAGSEEQGLGEKASSKARGTTSTGQVAIINLIVVEKVRRRLRAEHKGALARSSKVRAKAEEKSEFIAITSEAHSGKNAALLANLTAQTYIRRQNGIHQRGIEKAIAISRRQLRRIELTSGPTETPKAAKGKTGAGEGTAASGNSAAKGPSTSSIIQAANLSSKINQLESSLGANAAQQVKPAKQNSALLLSPKPRKDAIFGFVVGLVLASIAAYVLSRFDRRLRTLAAVESVFRLPIMAALPKVRRPIVRSEGGPRPSVQLLEPLRRLHTALELAHTTDRSLQTQGPGRVIAFVSADPGDGKSMLAADLAMIQRDAGERTVVVEANFRRPAQAAMLGLGGTHGLADALAGTVPVEDAMQRVLPLQHARVEHAQHGGENVATAVRSGAGSLFVLTGDRGIANPPALLAAESASDLLESLAADFDYVLIDAPSPLEVSDVMPILGLVTGIVVVARIGHTQEASAQRLQQLLEAPTTAPVIGVVANFAGRGELKKYGFSSPGGRPWSGRAANR
ncbi:MAG: tyrosine-protein kinase [Solirubrobacteraceae bacterium]|nr:tyrosine-protein kinase [Solirubrobacteraceae bacterium]